MKDPKAIGFRRISINDLDYASIMPNADAWHAGELDLPAGAFDCNALPGFGSACPVRAVRTQQVGEDGDCVVALEGDEGGRYSCTEWAEVLGQASSPWTVGACSRRSCSSPPRVGWLAGGQRDGRG